MVLSMIEEAQAIDWYEQRMAVKHFAMDVEFLLRRKQDWRQIMKRVLFTSGDIVAKGEQAEQ